MRSATLRYELASESGKILQSFDISVLTAAAAPLLMVIRPGSAGGSRGPVLLRSGCRSRGRYAAPPARAGVLPALPDSPAAALPTPSAAPCRACCWQSANCLGAGAPPPRLPVGTSCGAQTDTT